MKVFLVLVFAVFSFYKALLLQCTVSGFKNSKIHLSVKEYTQICILELLKLSKGTTLLKTCFFKG